MAIFTLAELAEILTTAEVADGTATLPTGGSIDPGPWWPSPETLTWGQLANLRDAFGELAERAKASMPKSERQLEQEAEAAEAFASFEQTCKAWVELRNTDEPITAERIAELAEQLSLDVDDLASFEYEADPWTVMETVIAPLSLESRDDSPDCNCQHCPEAGEHGTGDGPILHRLILCTGGPHFELQWPKGEADEATFVALPWFGRVEMPASGPMVELAEWLEDEGDDLGVWDD